METSKPFGDEFDYYAFDGETFFSRPSYSLSNMTTDAYIRDKRFQLQCASLANDSDYFTIRREDIAGVLASLDGTRTVMVAQHAQFDGAYLWYHYRWRPAYWIDTLSMSRAISGVGVRHSLKELCPRWHVSDKDVYYAGFEHKLYENMDEATRAKQRVDCGGDAWRTWRIAKQMWPLLPLEELRIIDLTVKQFTEPMIEGDRVLLAQLIADETQRKQELLTSLNIQEADLASDDRFEAVLLGEGIEVEYKDAKNARGKKGCFSVADEYFKRMLVDSDPRIRELFEARAAIKSTIQKTRAETFLDMANDGPMRVYYFYYGCRNARFAGGERTNFQNLPSRGHNGTGLRRAIRAPQGYVFVVPDLSQIECRMLVTCAGQLDKVRAFREGRDLYREAAALTFGVPLSEVTDLQRQCGKVQVLQLGYNAGWMTYLMSVKRMTGIDLGEEVARNHVAMYRADNPEVCKYWQIGEAILQKLAEKNVYSGVRMPSEPGQPSYEKPLFDIMGQKIVLPNGLKLHFDNIHKGPVTYTDKYGNTEEKMAWKVPTVSGFTTFYGGKLIQNINSALSRILLTQAELGVIDRAKWSRILLSTHDDAAFCCRQDLGSELKAIVDDEFTKSPVWIPNIPIEVKSSIRFDYDK